MSYTATYSPEDNKLRLYSTTRLDSETYARVKAAGFIGHRSKTYSSRRCGHPAARIYLLSWPGRSKTKTGAW